MLVQRWREKILNLLKRRNRYQFGQPKSDRVTNSGCTDTCIQLVVKIVKDLNVSLNKVRERSGAPDDEPMDADQALKALHSFGLPYEKRFGLTAAQVAKLTRTRGPVIVAEKYWAHPQWKGYRYLGKVLNGIATNLSGHKVVVGFARPLKRSGLTQTTFKDGHAILAAIDGYEGNEHIMYIRDSNHNSPARPERPAYDIVTMAQLNRMLKSWPVSSYCLVPSRRIIK